MDGPDDLGQYLSILFRADLDDILGGTRYGLYTLPGPAGPEGPPRVVVPSGGDRRYVLGIPLPPGMAQQAIDMAFPAERCIELVREATGRRDLAVEIVATNAFAFSAQVAARMRDGRVFLVGDSAHRMTPRGGRGMNTAIADAFDLGWKLAWVCRGIAGVPLLDSYESERGPIGRRNVALSMVPGGGSDDGLAEEGFVTDAEPGARAPHVWLAIGEERLSRRSTCSDGSSSSSSGATRRCGGMPKRTCSLTTSACPSECERSVARCSMPTGRSPRRTESRKAGLCSCGPTVWSCGERAARPPITAGPWLGRFRSRPVVAASRIGTSSPPVRPSTARCRSPADRRRHEARVALAGAVGGARASIDGVGDPDVARKGCCHRGATARAEARSPQERIWHERLVDGRPDDARPSIGVVSTLGRAGSVPERNGPRNPGPGSGPRNRGRASGTRGRSASRQCHYEARARVAVRLDEDPATHRGHQASGGEQPDA